MQQGKNCLDGFELDMNVGLSGDCNRILFTFMESLYVFICNVIINFTAMILHLAYL